MISDLNGLLGSGQFLNVGNERTCFASCACAFKGSGVTNPIYWSLARPDMISR